MDLARIAREDGWWARYDDLGVGPYFDLEQEAKVITYYSTSFIYGLLQTDDYARAIIRGINPLMDDQEQKERVEARMRRQELTNGLAGPGSGAAGRGGPGPRSSARRRWAHSSGRSRTLRPQRRS